LSELSTIVISVSPTYGIKERKECSLENEEERNLMLRKDGAVLSVTTVEWRKEKKSEKKGKR